MTDLEMLAEATRRLNAVGAEITRITDRPANRGTTGEFIAARIFDIALHGSGTHKGSDGRFTTGQLAGKLVNIKWYANDTGLLDTNLTPEDDLYYVVMTGDRTPATSSRGKAAPWVISYAFVFWDGPLCDALKGKRGTAVSVPRYLWDAAEVFPDSRSKLLVLTEQQKSLLRLFR